MLRDTFWMIVSVALPLTVGCLATILKRRQGYYEWYAQQFGAKAGIIASVIYMLVMRII